MKIPGFEFAPLPIAPMRTVAHLDIPIEVRGLHMTVLLHLYENLSETGALVGVLAWTDRQCFRLFGQGATRKKLLRLVDHNLANVQGDDLVIALYDVARVSRYRDKSEKGRIAAERQWSGRGLPIGSEGDDPRGSGASHPDGDPDPEDPEIRSEIRRDPEDHRNGSSSRGNRSPLVPEKGFGSRSENGAGSEATRQGHNGTGSPVKRLIGRLKPLWEAKYPGKPFQVTQYERRQLGVLLKGALEMDHHEATVSGLPRWFARYLSEHPENEKGHSVTGFLWNVNAWTSPCERRIRRAENSKHLWGAWLAEKDPMAFESLANFLPPGEDEIERVDWLIKAAFRHKPALQAKGNPDTTELVAVATELMQRQAEGARANGATA